jgi:hypothetical protein
MAKTPVNILSVIKNLTAVLAVLSTPLFLQDFS